MHRDGGLLLADHGQTRDQEPDERRDVGYNRRRPPGNVVEASMIDDRGIHRWRQEEALNQAEEMG